MIFPLVSTLSPVEERAKVPVVLPIATLPDEAASVVFPCEKRVVKTAVEGVVAPIAVLLMPVAVVLKLPDVKVRALVPVLMEDAPRPESDREPDVAVKLTAPVVTVSPVAKVPVPAQERLPVEAKIVHPVPVEPPLKLISPLVPTEERIGLPVVSLFKRKSPLLV